MHFSVVFNQEIWDVSRKVSCRFSEKISKYVTWSPLTVEMLDVQSSGKTGEVDCWMDVMKGVYPAVSNALNEFDVSNR